jgi:hypothetical protein
MIREEVTYDTHVHMVIKDIPCFNSSHFVDGACSIFIIQDHQCAFTTKRYTSTSTAKQGRMKLGKLCETWILDHEDRLCALTTVLTL